MGELKIDLGSKFRLIGLRKENVKAGGRVNSLLSTVTSAIIES